jgi:hypothetical protein
MQPESALNPHPLSLSCRICSRQLQFWPLARAEKRSTPKCFEGDEPGSLNFGHLKFRIREHPSKPAGTKAQQLRFWPENTTKNGPNRYWLGPTRMYK